MKHSSQSFLKLRNLIKLVLMFLPLVSTGQITFEKLFGGTSTESAYRVEICADSGYITAGYTRSSGPGIASMHLIRTDKYGEKKWDAVIGGNMVDKAYSVAVTNEGNYVAVGSTTSSGAGQEDIYIVKVDDQGKILWEKTFGGAGSEEGWDIKQTEEGGFIVTGFTNSFGASFFDAFLLKIDAAGNQQWQKNYGGASFDSGLCVRQTTDGGYAILGQTHSSGQGQGDFYFFKTDADGNEQWTKTYGGVAVDEGRYFSLTKDGGYILVGKTESFGAGGEDIYVVKTDVSGSIEWEKTYGGDLKDTGKSIEQTQDGGYIIASSSRSFNWVSPWAWFIKTDSEGETEWAKKFGGWNHDHGHHILPTADGGYIATGHFNREESQMEDTYLLKLDAMGDWVESTGIDKEFLASSFKIYPNPTTGMLELSLDVNLRSILEISIVNYTGKVVYTYSSETINGYFSKKIDMKSFTKGIYLIRVFDGRVSKTTKVILQ